jgi:hypothetical protein
MEYDAFLPSVAQRQNHILLLSLQLALAVVSAAGHHSVAAARQVSLDEHAGRIVPYQRAQAYNLLQEQREAFKSMLEQAALAPTMTSLKQSHLLIQLMRRTLPTISEADLVS